MLLAALLAWGVERLVVTDREAIESLVEGAAAAVNRDDWDAVATAFDEEITAGAKTKAALLAWIRDAALRVHPTSLSAHVLDLKIAGDRARARVHASGGSNTGPFGVSAEVDLARREDGWKITGISEAELGSPFR